MVETVGVIEVKVSKDDGSDCGGRKTEGCQLSVDLLVAGDREFELGTIEPGGKWAIRAKIVRMGDGGTFAGIDEEGTFGVPDHQGPDGQFVGKIWVENEVGDGKDVGEAGLAESGFNRYGAGGKEMQGHRAALGGQLNGGGGKHTTS